MFVKRQTMPALITKSPIASIALVLAFLQRMIICVAYAIHPFFYHSFAIPLRFPPEAKHQPADNM
jgi:hypothetical protein